ncbi:hypothetical protein [Microbacterium sp. UBA3394]|nr:hypothetical protein [Microbacterium sp. UBA3394]|tara:strand:+ start:21390 stop:21524 length:135 start_codon:yes stop_codon:yes gene_type:complete
MRTVYRHAGPRRRPSWWRGPWPPAILLVGLMPVLVLEILWVVSG